jgi:hypothetical protein
MLALLPTVVDAVWATVEALLAINRLTPTPSGATDGGSPTASASRGSWSGW